MSKEARNLEDLDLSPAVREKFEELVALLSAHGFGPDGPPKDTTFVQKEAFGHQAGRIARFATELFSPQRLALRIDRRSYSPTVLERLILSSSSIPSFELAAKLAGQVAEIHISGRHLQNLTTWASALDR